jgi:hypothetical protein
VTEPVVDQSRSVPIAVALAAPSDRYHRSFFAAAFLKKDNAHGRQH